jgi:hypothetical protein
MNILDLLAANETILGVVGTTNAPTSTAKFPMPRGTLVFLQLAYTQAFNILIRALVNTGYNANNVYLLYGCDAESVSTVGGSTTYVFNPGAIYFQGEIFLCDGGQVTVPNGSSPYYSVVTGYYRGDGADADPVTYTDKTVHYIHKIRKIIISASSNGNIGQYSQAIHFSFAIPAPVNLTGTGSTTISGAYPNIQISVPPQLNAPIASGSVVVGGNGDIYGQGPQTMPLGTYISDTNYYVMGTLRSYGIPYNDATAGWALASRGNTSFQIAFNEWKTTGSDPGYKTQYLKFDYVVFAAE